MYINNCFKNKQEPDTTEKEIEELKIEIRFIKYPNTNSNHQTNENTQCFLKNNENFKHIQRASTSEGQTHSNTDII